MQEDTFRIDSHKIMYHVDRLASWKRGDLVYPIYMEIGPVGMCNHRCTFCSVDFMGYKNVSIDKDILKKRLAELGKLGLKSIMYAGEGEPLLHRNIIDIVSSTFNEGIDVAITTNGVFLDEEFLDTSLSKVSWIKVSCNAGSHETYSRIHRSKTSDFDKVFKNLKYAANLRNRDKLECTLGIQIILLPENAEEVYDLGVKAMDIGLDYMVVKPYTHQYRNQHDFHLHYNDFMGIDQKLDILRDKGFQVVFRTNAMEIWDQGQRTYKCCLALPFWSRMDASGNIWGCGEHLKDKRFLYGNIYDNTFEEIWTGEKRRKSLQWSESEFDLSLCKLNCRMDKINQYLWNLKHYPPHVNFI